LKKVENKMMKLSSVFFGSGALLLTMLDTAIGKFTKHLVSKRFEEYNETTLTFPMNI